MALVKTPASLRLLLIVFCTIAAQGVSAQTARIMVVGDSISAGWENPSYRMPLVNTLKAESCDIDMVGDQSLTTRQFSNLRLFPGKHFPSFDSLVKQPDGAHWTPSLGDDTDHQAFPGIQTDELANGVASVLPIASYVGSEQPDYILLQTGSSDLSKAISDGMRTDTEISKWANETVAEIGLIVDRAISAHQSPSGLKILIGNHIPGYTIDHTNGGQIAADQAAALFTEKVTAFVESRQDSRVLLVDVASGYDKDQMADDGLNPNTIGENHIAGAFLTVLRGAGLCAESYPAVSSPSVGSVIYGDSTSITWRDNGTKVDSWRVYVGASQSGSASEYLDSGYETGSDRTITVSGLPEDGSNVFITIEYQVEGVTDITMSSFISVAQARLAKHSAPVLLAPGLDSGSATSGSTPLAASGQSLLRFAVSAASADTTVGGGVSQASIVSPSANSVLSGSSQTFSWSKGSGVISQWWFRAGSTAGGKNYFDSGRITTASQRSISVTNLPTNGSTVHVGLHYKTQSGAWEEVRYTYKAASSDGSTSGGTTSGGGSTGGGTTGGGSAEPAVLSPAAGSVLSGTAQTFNWDSGSGGIGQWWFRAGSTAGGRNYFDSGRITNANQRSITATNLPNNGSTVHVGLHYKTLSGTWKEVRYTYKAASTGGTTSGGGTTGGSTTGGSTGGSVVKASLASPAAGSVLSGGSQKFTWNKGSGDIRQWWFRAGSTAGGRNYFDSGRITNAGQRSITATNLPTNGSTVHVSLHYKTLSGTWQEVRSTYKAASTGGGTTGGGTTGGTTGGSTTGGGTSGGGSSGGSEPPPLNLSTVRWLHTDVSGWAESASMTNVSVSSSSVCLNYDKANSWPSRNIYDADLVGNAWVFIWNESQSAWYGATWEWLRPGQICKSASAVNGEHIKQGPYSASSGWKPTSGETLYFMVSGLARTSQRNVLARTRPVKVIWP